MLSGHAYSRRRRGGNNNRTARIAIPLAAVIVLGLAVGIFVASSGNGTTKIRSAAAASGSAGVSSTAVEDTCDIVVPAHPLTAKGLATPYQLTGPSGGSPAATGCQMINSFNLGAFVQATILNPRTGALSVYNPLVITAGTKPAIKPVLPKLPKGAIVTIEFGFNGTFLIQTGATPDALAEGNCTDGPAESPFGQVSFCNGINFFDKAADLERSGRLTVPSAGTSRTMVATDGTLGTGQECPTTRNFDMVDQDPSDNVTTKYLLDPATGQTAQDTASNSANMPGSTLLANGSDNTLLDAFMDPLFGCTPFQAPDLANNGMPTSSQALDELLSAAHPPAITAFVPENDEMVLNSDNQFDAAKTNLYREEIGQATISAQNSKTSSPAMFCQNMVDIQTPFLAANQGLLATGQSPVSGVGDNLLTFLANRLSMSFTNLSCQTFGLTDPVTVTLNGQGSATTATFDTSEQTATNTGTTPAMPGSGTPGAPPRTGRAHHRVMDPSGM